MNKEIRLVALDMDGTVLNSNGLISDKNKKMITEAMNNGIHVAIASGRSFSSLPKDVLSISGIEYAITSNGATIYKTQNGECILRHVLSESSVRDILNILRTCHEGISGEEVLVSLEIFVDGTPYTNMDYYNDPMKYGATEWAVNYIHNTRHPVENITQFIVEHSSEIDAIDIVTRDFEFKEKIIAWLDEHVKDIFITSSVRNLIEISSINAGKGKALQYLAKYLKVNMEETCGMGDQCNDIELLQACGYSVAMGNACDELKEMADFITKTNNEDGVAFALEKIINKEI